MQTFLIFFRLAILKTGFFIIKIKERINIIKEMKSV